VQHWTLIFWRREFPAWDCVYCMAMKPESLFGVMERHTSRGVKTNELEGLDGLKTRQEGI